MLPTPFEGKVPTQLARGSRLNGSSDVTGVFSGSQSLPARLSRDYLVLGTGPLPKALFLPLRERSFQTLLGYARAPVIGWRCVVLKPTIMVAAFFFVALVAIFAAGFQFSTAGGN